MKLERKHAVLFLAISAWNVFSYANFTKNLVNAYQRGEDRPTGYWVAHSVLIVVNLLIAGVLGRLGVKAWRATRSGTPSDTSSGTPGEVAGEPSR